MKKLFMIFLFLLYGSFNTSAQINRQDPLPYSSPGTYPKGGIIPMERDLPLLVIGSLETNVPSLVMDHSNLKIIKTYEEPKDLIHFGDKGNAGVIVAELKTKIPLFRLTEVLDYFKVPADIRHLEVLVDKKMVNPDLFLADIKMIQKIEVFEVTQEDVVLSLFYNSLAKGEKYLNIVTVPKF